MAFNILALFAYGLATYYLLLAAWDLFSHVAFEPLSEMIAQSRYSAISFLKIGLGFLGGGVLLIVIAATCLLFLKRILQVVDMIRTAASKRGV